LETHYELIHDGLAQVLYVIDIEISFAASLLPFAPQKLLLTLVLYIFDKFVEENRQTFEAHSVVLKDDQFFPLKVVVEHLV
jgi:hypothetical protein